MPPQVHIVHQTQNRLRLRIPEKRKDITYFLSLYEDLRQIPGVTDTVINPITGSVLLHFPAESSAPVLRSLQRIGVLHVDIEEERKPGVLRRAEFFFAKGHGGAAQMRAVLLVIITAMAIHQVRRGILLAPALSVLWYAYDVFASHKRPRGPRRTSAQTPSTGPGP